MVGWLLFYGISTFVGCLTPNPLYTYIGCLNTLFYIGHLKIYGYIGCFKIHGTLVTADNTTSNNNLVFFFVSDLKIVYNNSY